MNDYPPIDPTTFDLIILGTGLPESIIAAAAASAGKSVLHLDPNPFYGTHFASFNPNDLSAFLKSHSSPPSDYPINDPTTVELATRSLYSDVEISCSAPELVEEQARNFELDVSGPRVLFCADKAIDAMLKSGTNQYVEFKSIDASFICGEDGVLMNVPDSRSAIFKDKTLTLMEKNKLMKFFKLVQLHFASDGSDSERISEEDLESPFAEFLAKMRLPAKIKSIILYSIAMADYDQDNMEVRRDILKTKDGIDRLALYQSSLGRFQNASGALIYPFHGQGELSQAFCRRAAVKGCLYVLRMPVVSLHINEDTRQYKGIRLASGQDLFSDKLVLGPSFEFPSQIGSSPRVPIQASVPVSNQKDVIAKVSRGICITSASLRPDSSNLLVVYPPRSLFQEQVTAVRVLQLGSNVAVCPPGTFVLYLSALCDEPNQGKELLNAALSALEVSQSSESSPKFQNEDTEAAKPFILWKALYIQELTTEHQFEAVTSTPSPDGNLDYNALLDVTENLFHMIYPDEVYFPEKNSPENDEDDGLLESS